ncbi:MAG: zinc-dependent metalloprotease, partial [Spirosomaceae bacterium]|nr:zinc-dependent metalloprotease [Spirosomataceae bacterium]
LTGSKPGRNLRQVVPTATAVTMHQHHSFVKLPDVSGYKMREYDPRIGYLGISYYDYASAISEPIEKRFTSRHRLQKKNPTAAQSEAVEPIIYYMDRGAPEPIRSALMEGALWWNQAFEAAGYKDAFQVKLLPEDADPMDVRYNLIQWVHRSTRGWSYGASITDPRTGEILKGKITLGSLRVRQDFMIAQGLVGNFETDTSNVAEITQMALSRLRQLAAHEVGHTLGLPHNYISSISGRASVMDYPHPLVAEVNGKITLDAAYAEGMGGYDISAIQWGYQDFPEKADEKAELERIVQNMFRKGFQFLTDQDARPVSSVHPQTHLWDNGESATEELRRLSKIRSIVLANFDERKIRNGEPMATLEEVFVPMYMFHRFQVEAAAKSIAGAYYGNVRKGDAQTVFLPVSAKEQWLAFDALMETIAPDFLSVPMSVIKNIPPRPYRYSPNQREVFSRTTGMGFDPLAPPKAAATLTLTFLLHPERAARLAVQKAYSNDLPGLNEVLDRMTK